MYCNLLKEKNLKRTFQSFFSLSKVNNYDNNTISTKRDDDIYGNVKNISCNDADDFIKAFQLDYNIGFKLSVI